MSIYFTDNKKKVGKMEELEGVIVKWVLRVSDLSGKAVLVDNKIQSMG